MRGKSAILDSVQESGPCKFFRPLFNMSHHEHSQHLFLATSLRHPAPFWCMLRQIELYREEEEEQGQYVPDYYLVQSDIFVDPTAWSLHNKYIQVLEWLASFGVHMLLVWIAHHDIMVHLY